MVGRDLAREVTLSHPRIEGEGGGLRIVALDTGIKRSIVRNFVKRGVQLELYPCTTPAGELLDRNPDGFFLVPGPGDPAALDYIVDTIRDAARPQAGVRDLPRPPAALARRRAGDLQAAVRPPRRQPSGQGPRDRADRDHLAEPRLRGRRASPARRIESELGAAELTHVNLYDGTVEGFRLLDVPAACVQYHPEAGPGPNDSLGLFDLFIDEFDRAA